MEKIQVGYGPLYHFPGNAIQTKFGISVFLGELYLHAGNTEFMTRGENLYFDAYSMRHEAFLTSIGLGNLVKGRDPLGIVFGKYLDETPDNALKHFRITNFNATHLIISFHARTEEEMNGIIKELADCGDSNQFRKIIKIFDSKLLVASFIIPLSFRNSVVSVDDYSDFSDIFDVDYDPADNICLNKHVSTEILLKAAKLYELL